MSSQKFFFYIKKEQETKDRSTQSRNLKQRIGNSGQLHGHNGFDVGIFVQSCLHNFLFYFLSNLEGLCFCGLGKKTLRPYQNSLPLPLPTKHFSQPFSLSLSLFFFFFHPLFHLQLNTLLVFVMYYYDYFKNYYYY